MHTISLKDLATGNFSLELEGTDHGDPGVSLIFVDAAPGRGPSLHTHDYAEVMVIEEGTATFTDGTTTETVGAGSIVIIPAGEPHAFTCVGDSRLKQLDIHVSNVLKTDWLQQEPDQAS